jgi:hypothetical protein
MTGVGEVRGEAGGGQAAIGAGLVDFVAQCSF